MPNTRIINEYAKIGFKERASFGAGDLATNIAWGAMASYIVFFYTDVIGVAAAVVGTIMLLSRLLDGVSDVAMGAIVDRTQSKRGKARPWLFWLAIPFAISLVLIFTVPEVSSGWQIAYIVVTYNVLVLVFTAIVIPYGTLNTRLTRDFTERSKLNVMRMFCATFGVLLVTVFTVPIVDSFGGGQSAWVLTFVLFGAVATVLFYVTYFNTRERIIDTSAPRSQPGFKKSISLALKNKYWILLFLIFIVFSVAEAMYTGSAAYFARYRLGDTSFVALMSFMLYIPALIGMLFMQPLYNRLGKVKPIIIGSVIVIIGSVIIAIDPTNIYLASLGSIVRGIGRIPIFGAIWGMLPDTIEYGEWKTKTRLEGVLYSAGSMGQKAGYGLGVAALGWMLGAAGYQGLAATQPDSALFAIDIGFIWGPIVLFAILIILFAFYRLERIYPTVETELVARRRAAAAHTDA